MTDNYATLMLRGDRALNQGHTTVALQAFLNARLAFKYPYDGEAEHMSGICYRMLGHYAKATQMFSRAYQMTKSDSHKGRVKRDWAMALLAQGYFDDALVYLDESLTLLHGPENRVEHATTKGFIGRVYLARGDKDLACCYFHEADRYLRRRESSDTYELNNLVWWMKAAGFFKRVSLARRAWKLARQADNRKRQLQITLLLICRPLAVRLNRT